MFHIKFLAIIRKMNIFAEKLQREQCVGPAMEYPLSPPNLIICWLVSSYDGVAKATQNKLFV